MGAMSRSHVPFRVLREAVRIIFVLKIGSGFASGFARVRKDSDALGVLPAVPFRMAEVQESEEVYGRFMGGSDQNTGNPGQFGQSRQFMHIVQSRINIGYWASC
jgi:hypothetical protein